jgi:N-acetylneuraminic acid mutarotase
VFNLAKKAWTAEYDLPEEMAKSHLGMIFDGQRYIYAVSGQKGNRCRPPTNLCFVFDTFNDTWNDFPALPEARYAPKVQLWQGRLHVLSGSKEDRNTPSVDYWSIAVKDGKAIENEWAKEIDAPRGGPHGATAVLNNKLYSFGGQEGDYIAIPGDPEFRCTGRLTDEKVYSDVYCLESGDKHWTRLADMPIPTSHTEFSIIVHGDKVLICGGTEYKNPETKELYLTDAIQCYDVPTDTWSILGRMPYRVKSVGVAYYKEFLYITLGQSDRDKDDARPGNYDNRTWRSKIVF